ncbi:hypothetical protein HYW46_02840 [Candidatus Daviesbacteria bacterium]|nr:hypothetical protein [Candidatus Daviesbacteria bacterium]
MISIKKELETVQDYVDIWTKHLGTEFFRELVARGGITDEEAERIVDQTTKRAAETFEGITDPKLKDALNQTKLPFPKRNP